MKCSFCGKLGNKVTNSRLTNDGSTIRRRRECLHCLNRFTTYENAEKILLMVTKKNGRHEPFSRDKIRKGICKAREKLDISLDDINRIVSSVEFEFTVEGQKEILSSSIGEKVMLELHKLSDIAYVRFASVYREFKNVSDFVSTLENLLKENNNFESIENT